MVVETYKHDRYGRILSKVLVGGNDVCLEQIKAGLAWLYKKHRNQQTASDRKLYGEAEDAACAAKRGLWQDPRAIPPWAYRADKRR